MALGKDAFRVETKGFGFMKEYVNQLKSSQFMTAVAGSMRKASKPVEKAVKAAASKYKDSSGATKASIDTRVRRYPKHSTVVGMVGAKTAFTRQHGKEKLERRPSKYAHLLEYGHKIQPVAKAHLARDIRKKDKAGNWYQYHKKQVGKPVVTGQVPPYPYVGPGMTASSGQYKSIMASELPKRVDDAARKAAAKTQGQSP